MSAPRSGRGSARAKPGTTGAARRSGNRRLTSPRGGDTDGTLGGGNGAAVVLSAVSGAITAGTGVPAGTILAPTDRGGAITARGGNDFNSVGGSGGNAGAITVNAGN